MEDYPNSLLIPTDVNSKVILAEGEPIESKNVCIKIEDIPRDHNGHPLFEPVDYLMV